MTEIKKRRGRPPKAQQIPPVVDWEALSKHLQKAIESLIEENNVLIKANENLANKNVRLEAIVGYLESRLDRAHNPV
jgi:hypothetical protein